MKATAAISSNGIIGNNGKIPWRSKEDMAFFKEMTLGKTVLCGSKTYLSFGPNGLKNRQHIVLSRKHEDLEFQVSEEAHSTVCYVNTPEAVMEIVKELESAGEEVWLCGGGEIYSIFLPECSDLFLTIFDFESSGDTEFPEYDKLFTNCKTIKSIENGTIYHFSK